MLKAVTLAAGISFATAASAFAQTSPAPTPAPVPATPATPPAATMPAPSSTRGDVVLTEEQAKAWIDKRVYSSDNKNIGEVAAFARDSSNRVTELHADVGGFLGMGETRVRIQPTQFRLDGDKVVLNLTAEQAKALPQIAKK